MKFPISYKGNTWIRPVLRNDQELYEIILVDEIPQQLIKQIQSVINETIKKIPKNPTRDELEKGGRELSEWTYKNLPFNWYSSAEQFDKQRASEVAFYKDYYFDSFTHKPYLLSELIEEESLTCNSQGLIIKEALQSEQWGLFSLFSEKSYGNHHLLAKDAGDYILRIDGVAGPRQVKRSDKSEYIYTFTKSDFYKRYVPSKHIWKQIKFTTY